MIVSLLPDVGMGWLTQMAFLCMLCVSATGRIACQENPTQIDEEQTTWISGVLKDAQTIKAGMTRSDLMKVFTTEGGLSTSSQRKYVYRQCPYIKIDVKFAAASPPMNFRRTKLLKSHVLTSTGRSWIDHQTGRDGGGRPCDGPFAHRRVSATRARATFRSESPSKG